MLRVVSVFNQNFLFKLNLLFLYIFIKQKLNFYFLFIYNKNFYYMLITISPYFYLNLDVAFKFLFLRARRNLTQTNKTNPKCTKITLLLVRQVILLFLTKKWVLRQNYGVALKSLFLRAG